MHQGLLVDVAARTHRDRQGRTSPLDDMALGDSTLYIAGMLPNNPRFRAYQRWLLPAHGWVVGRFDPQPGQRPMDCDWYIDIDAITIDGGRWRAEDRLLDVKVFDHQRYEIDDADELADCMEQQQIAPVDAIAAIRSLHALCRALERLNFSGDDLLAEYAPDLPSFRPWPDLTRAS